MLKGFITGCAVVGFLWAHQWYSPANQETRAYAEYKHQCMKAETLTKEDMEYSPPKTRSALPRYEGKGGPVWLTVEDLG